jgi:acetyl esterase/lipase
MRLINTLPPLTPDRLESSRCAFDPTTLSRRRLDLAYATQSEAQKLDLYLPDGGDGPFPLVLYVHGGGFEIGDKASDWGIVQAFLCAPAWGFAIASINYRLSGEAVFPAAVHDVKAAVRFCRANASELGIDPTRIAACGESAGGNLAAMACVLTGREELEDWSLGWQGVSSDVQAGVIWYPVTDFAAVDDQMAVNAIGGRDRPAGMPGSCESLYLGGPFSQLDPAFVQQANPATFVHEAIPPMLIQHGRLDRLVPWQQSELLADRIETVCGPDRVRFDLFEQADHADALFETADNLDVIFGFLAEVLSPGRGPQLRQGATI